MSDQTQPQTRKPLATGRIALIAALLGAVIFVCLNIVSAQIFRDARVDLTEQHLYSLSQGTRSLLGELKEPVRFRLFMSSGLTKQAPQLAAFAGRVRSLLDSYAAAAKGNIILEVIDPRPFSEEEDRAVAFGIDGFTGVGGERLFFGLAATNSTTGRATIGVFAPDREAFLEYDLTRLVSELGRRGKPVVALLDGLGLDGDPPPGPQRKDALHHRSMGDGRQRHDDLRRPVRGEPARPARHAVAEPDLEPRTAVQGMGREIRHHPGRRRSGLCAADRAQCRRPSGGLAKPAVDGVTRRCARAR